MIAILCVAKNSIYRTLDVDCYDIDRDVRTFPRNCPVVAHPPCRSWSAYCAHQAKPLPGEKELGPLCVDILRECGWWSMEVNQSWWGDSRIKKTWLLIAGVLPCDLPAIPFRLHDTNGDRRRWQVMSKHQRSATHPEFAKWLIEVAKVSDKVESLRQAGYEIEEPQT